jgi:hypothetical protein
VNRRQVFAIAAIVAVFAFVLAFSGCGGGGGGGGGSRQSSFCDTHACIPNFYNGSGYVVQCNDGMWSHSGGEPGACSYDGGER